jgi:FkbM family methyltransferase
VGWLSVSDSSDPAASNVAALLAEARALLDGGRLQAAEALYRQLLAVGADDPSIRINLAALCQRRGELAKADVLLRQEIEASPCNPLAQFNWGVVLADLGDSAGAMACYRQCLELQPGHAEAATNLALLLAAGGDLQAAEPLLRRAVAVRPEFAAAHTALGSILRQLGDREGAITAFCEALRLNPHDPAHHSNLAGVLLERGEALAAIASCQAALAIDPQHMQALGNLAAAQLEHGEIEAAIGSCRAALRLHPEASQAVTTLAAALLEQGEIEAAIYHYHQALALTPECADAHYNLGLAFHQRRDASRAIACYREALRLRPSYAAARWNLALSSLLAGDYTRGWELFDAPALIEALAVRPAHARPLCALWEGEPLGNNEPLLLVSEQGLGDTLQFVRYLPLLAARGLRVSLCTEEKLHGLLAASRLGVPLLSPAEGNAVSTGRWLRLLSLPRLLQVTPENPQTPAFPYLHSSPGLLQRWQLLLAPERRPLIGLHWQGNPASEVKGLRGRSLPLERFAPLAAAGIGSLLSLQRGSGSEQLEECSFRQRFAAAQQAIGAVWEFEELAAIVSQCDLVITTDSAMAHLAGALGLPTWLLLHHQAEWRWGLEESSSFWYPTMRLFRQQSPGDWDGVIERVAAELLCCWPGRLSARGAHLNQFLPLPVMAGHHNTALAALAVEPRAVELCDGTQVLVPDSLECLSTYVLQEQRDWFEDELRFLRRLVQPGQAVIDIGANVGVYSLCLARMVGPTGQVWAFEPASEPATLLARSIELNGTPWLRLQRQGVSDRIGSGWLHQPGQSELNALAAPGEAPDFSAGETVALTSLDACLEEYGWSRVDLLKIDAEGEEERILLGGERFFATLAPMVLFELKAGSDLHLELVDRFAQLNYRCYRLVPGLDALVPFNAAEGVDGYLLNLFAVPEARLAPLIEAQLLIDPAQAAPPVLAAAERQAAATALCRMALGRALAPGWPEPASEPAQSPDWQCLAGWALAHDPSRPLSARYGALQLAFRSLRAHCDAAAPAGRWASLARMALELGERQQAVAAAQQLLEALGQQGPQDWCQEPFLPPHPSVDGLDPAGSEQDWLLAAALITVEVAGAFSGYFTGSSALPRLEKIRDLGFAVPEIGRRLDLLQRRLSQGAGAEGGNAAAATTSPRSAPISSPGGAPAAAGELLQSNAGWGGGYFTGLTYGAYSFGELAPNWIDFALLSQRQRPPRSGAEGSPFHYLELGSGMGLGLCLLAAAYPEGRFVGIDFHPSHIAHSQWLADELGLANVCFYEADFLELAAPGARLPFDPGAGFHYAVAHGILSWIGPEVRAALMHLAGRLLRPGGAFYCSYNTYPGWLDRSAFKALADLERQRLGAANLPLALERAGDSLERLLRSARPLAQALPQLAAQLGRIRETTSPDYLCGEFGAEHWQPFYVGQVHQLAAAHKLSYAASASLPDNFPSLLPAPEAQLLAAEVDPTIRQALQDLAINQSFRRDLFLKGPLPLSRTAQEQSLSQLLLRTTGTAGGAADQPLRIDTNLGVMADEQGRLRQLEALLAAGPASLAELHEAMTITPEELVLFTSLLLHAGRVGLDRGPAGAAATAGCRVVNGQLIALMQGGHKLGYLAAPTTGHGAQAFSLVDGFVLEGLLQGLEGEVLSSCVLLGLQATGVELRNREGVLLSEPAECLSLLDSEITRFRDTTLPRLVQLGIIDPPG